MAQSREALPSRPQRCVTSKPKAAACSPATFAGRGTHVLWRDPQRAVFGVLKSDSGDPADTPVNDGDFVWLDLLARDPKKAAEFYQGSQATMSAGARWVPA